MINFFNKRIFVIFIFPLFLGGITVFSFQPFNFFFINFFSLTTLFFLIVYVKKKSKSIYRKKPFFKNLFILGTSYGFGFFLLNIHWILYSLTFDDVYIFLIPFSLILIPLFLSLFFSIPILLVGNFCEKNLYSILLISISFAFSDFLRNFVLGGFPWNLWVYSFSWSVESLQILSVIGLFSLNLLAITIFFIPSLFFFKLKTNYLIICFFIFLVFGNYFYGSYKINSEIQHTNLEKVNFKIVSAGINLNEFKDEKDVVLKLIKYSEPDKKKKTIFIWPEGVFLNENFKSRKDIKDLFEQNFSDNHLIIFGANTSKSSPQKKIYYNSMLLVDKNLNYISKYDKRKLVPFGEFLPFEDLFKSFGLKKISFGYNSFSKGNNKPVVDLKSYPMNINFLSLICYEIIFPNYVNKFSNFNFIINISEDAWFGESIGPHQHFAKAILRSIESGVYTIRSANKGVSAFISSNGKILKSLQPDEIGNIELRIPIQNKSNKQSKKDLIFLLLLITYIFTIFVLLKIKNK